MSKFIPSFKGKKHTNEAKLRISFSHKGKKRLDITGNKHPLYGKGHSTESRKKISETRKSLRIIPWNKGKKGLQKAWNKNLHLTKEQKTNIGGINHWNWKGGITEINKRERKSIEYKLWRTAVFERDNFTCTSCKKSGIYLEADHIKPFSTHRQLRYVLANGRTLCKSCHRKTNTYGVRKNKKPKKALIFGITGQDGSYLAEFLLDNGYEVHGVIRRSSSFNKQRIDHLRDKIHYHYGDITDPFSILHILKDIKPDELYNLCAQSHVGISWENPYLTAQITGVGVLNLLEAVRVLDMQKSIRIYNAATSEMFSGLEGYKQNEDTPKDPVSPYGTAKLYAFQLCKNYRDAYGMFISNGILFNHESPRRGDNFVTKKIVNEAHKGKVELGNVDAMRDWGFAPDYCEAMWLMLQKDKPDDYVIATGVTTSIKSFVGFVEKAYGNKIKIIHNKEYDRPVDVPVLCGDASKAEKELGWKATVSVEQLAEIMVKEQYEN